MENNIPEDLAEKTAIMREFGRLRAAGEHVSPRIARQTHQRYQ